MKSHTTFLGGDFGRRFEMDFIHGALEVSKSVIVPVKVIWSSEDDVRREFYRPASHHVLRASLDASRQPVGSTHKVVAPSAIIRFFPQSIGNGLDGEAVEGAVAMPYAIPNVQVDHSMADTGIPEVFWRSVNNSYNGWVVESFLDELEHAAKRDPCEFRRDLLAKAPRHLAVFNLAAKKAGWGTPLPAGRARDIAVVKSFESFVAQVAEMSVEATGAVRVLRVVRAVDCGPVVNRAIVEAQMQSGILFGLTAALYGKFSISAGGGGRAADGVGGGGARDPTPASFYAGAHARASKMLRRTRKVTLSDSRPSRRIRLRSDSPRAYGLIQNGTW